MSATRIYVVHGEGLDPRLVRAASQAQAIRHVVASKYDAEVAKPETLVELLGIGATVENASPKQADLIEDAA